MDEIIKNNPAHWRRILKKYDELENEKLAFMTTLRDVPGELYSRQPNPLTWSPAQIGQHLYTSENGSLLYLRKKLSYPDSVPRYHPLSWTGIGLIHIVFFFGIKIKAPAVIDMSKVKEPMTLAQLEDNWSEVRKQIKDFLEQQHNAFARHRIFRHPFAGRMTMLQMLIFFKAHLRHHHVQLKRVISQLHTAG